MKRVFEGSPETIRRKPASDWLKAQVWEQLQANGRGSFIPYRKLAQDILGADGPNEWRAIARAIEFLRRDGHPIISRRSQDGGAGLPATEEEGITCLKTGYAAIRHQKEALDRLQGSIEALFGEGAVQKAQKEFYDEPGFAVQGKEVEGLTGAKIVVDKQ